MTATLTLSRRFVAKAEAGSAIAAALAPGDAAAVVLGNPGVYVADLVVRLDAARIEKANASQRLPAHMKVVAVETGPALDPATGEVLSLATVQASLRALYGTAAKVAVLGLDGTEPTLTVVLEPEDGTFRARFHWDPTWRSTRAADAGGSAEQRAEDRISRALRRPPTSPSRHTVTVTVTVPVVYSDAAEDTAPSSIPATDPGVALAASAARWPTEAPLATDADPSARIDLSKPTHDSSASDGIRASDDEPGIVSMPCPVSARPRTTASNPAEPALAIAGPVVVPCPGRGRHPPACDVNTPGRSALISPLRLGLVVPHGCIGSVPAPFGRSPGGRCQRDPAPAGRDAALDPGDCHSRRAHRHAAAARPERGRVQHPLQARRQGQSAVTYAADRRGDGHPLWTGRLVRLKTGARKGFAHLELRRRSRLRSGGVIRGRGPPHDAVSWLTNYYERPRAEPWAAADAPPPFFKLQLESIVGVPDAHRQCQCQEDAQSASQPSRSRRLRHQRATVGV